MSRLETWISGSALLQSLHSQLGWRRDQSWAFKRGGLLLLALLLMLAAGAQSLFTQHSIYSNLAYVVMAVTALVTSLLMRKQANRKSLEKFVQRTSVAIVVGSLLVAFIPGTQSHIFLLTLFSVLLWFWGSSALIFPISSAIGWCLLGLFSLTVMITDSSPFTSAEVAVIATSLCGLFSMLMAYGYRQILASVLMEEREYIGDTVAEDTIKGAETDSKVSEQKSMEDVAWASILKNTAIEMAVTHDVDLMYKKLLQRVKSAVPCDIVVLGKLQNRVMFPIVMLDKNGQRNVDGSLRMIWSLSLLDALDEKKDVNVGLSDASVLDSFFDEGQVPFGFRLDIPFFSQKKLIGVVSLFRQKQAFTRYEVDLTSSIVFHGMLAHRSAIIQNRLSHLSTQSIELKTKTADAADKTVIARAEADAGVQVVNVLASEEFIQKADSGFRDLEKSGKPVSLLLIELDGYAKYSRKYARPTVDALFNQLSILLEANLPQGSLFGRYGKGSFAIQVSMEADRAKHLAEHLRYLVQKRAFKLEGTKENVTVSIGVSSKTSKTLDFLSVLKRADIGLYKAKYGTGNVVHVNL